MVSKKSRGKTIHPTLHEKCEHLKTMPSLAFGGKSCSILYKIVEMEMDTNSWLPAQQAWAAGLTVLKLIGYDGSPADMRRSSNPGDAKYTYCYPLRDAGLMRPQLIEIIAAMGWEQAGKSSCWMCPATKKNEFESLMKNSPDLLARALRMEAAAMLQSARTGKKMTTKGLGRRWSWREHLLSAMPAEMAALELHKDVGTLDWMEYQSIVQRNKDMLADPGALEEVDRETCDGALTP